MRRRPLLIGGAAALILMPFAAGAQVIAEEAAQNEIVRRRLQRAGDDGRLPRQVIHSVFPKEGAASAEVVQKALEDLALEVRPAPGGGLQARQIVAVRGEAFDAFTSALVRLMAENNWQYDGWETTAVQKPKERSN